MSVAKKLLSVISVLFAIISNGQAPLPDNMTSLGKVKGFADGTGYQIWSNDYSVDHFRASSPANKTVRYFDRFGTKAGFVMGDEVYSPNGLCVAGNRYPATTHPLRNGEPLTKNDYKDWATFVTLARPDPANPNLVISKDTSWFENYFVIAITNDGLLICSNPTLKSKNRWEKNELTALNDLYTYDLVTGKKTTLHSGQIWEAQSGQTYSPEWGLTPNSKIFYYTDHFEGIHLWDVASGAHMFINPATDKTDPPPGAKWRYSDGKTRKKGFDFSISDFETIVKGTVTENGNYLGAKEIFYNNLTGKELARHVANDEKQGGLMFIANTLYSLSNKVKGRIHFWLRDSISIVPIRTVQLDTLYMTDGPQDKFKIEVITPDKAAVWNNYDRLYIMELEFGKSKIVYSDIRGQRLGARQIIAQKKECEQRMLSVKFQNGTTIVYNKTGYIVKGYDCYEDKYHITTVVEAKNYPPYSSATITRYDLKPVTALMATDITITSAEMSEAVLATQQYEFCGFCKGMGGQWKSEAITGPSVLVNLNSKTWEYKPLGTMVYNYEVCEVCKGKCWMVKPQH